MYCLLANLYVSQLKKTELKEMLVFLLSEIYEHFHYFDYTPESLKMN